MVAGFTRWRFGPVFVVTHVSFFHVGTLRVLVAAPDVYTLRSEWLSFPLDIHCLYLINHSRMMKD